MEIKAHVKVPVLIIALGLCLPADLADVEAALAIEKDASGRIRSDQD
jgi:hypothetical protein